MHAWLNLEFTSSPVPFYASVRSRSTAPDFTCGQGAACAAPELQFARARAYPVSPLIALQNIGALKVSLQH